mmetsp:Transcript_39798/g.104109  ORF Transcript_39798/g.104109 Transcript_39798/m.104109 type:complete len:206 (+) Transcript_39798:659-1276(+)
MPNLVRQITRDFARIQVLRKRNEQSAATYFLSVQLTRDLADHAQNGRKSYNGDEQEHAHHQNLIVVSGSHITITHCTHGDQGEVEAIHVALKRAWTSTGICGVSNRIFLVNLTLCPGRAVEFSGIVADGPPDASQQMRRHKCDNDESSEQEPHDDHRQCIKSLMHLVDKMENGAHLHCPQHSQESAKSQILGNAQDRIDLGGRFL